MSQKSVSPGLARLSPRERQVYEIRQAGGKTWAQIAQSLGIAVKTAEIHYARARIKLLPSERQEPNV